jgi:hypothetical protein
MRENSIVGSRTVRKNFDFAVVGYFFLAAAIVPWLIWLGCFLLNQSSDERIIMFYQIIPRTLAGIGSDQLMVLSASLALLSGIIEKLQSGRKWYKTDCYVRCLILFSGLFLFMNVLQIIF